MLTCHTDAPKRLDHKLLVRKWRERRGGERKETRGWLWFLMDNENTYCLYQQMDTLPGIGIYVPACLWVCMCLRVLLETACKYCSCSKWKRQRVFCNALQQKDSIDSGETLRNKKNLFFTCCHLLHYHILLRCCSHKFPLMTILSSLKSPFNERFSYFKILSYAAVVVERRTLAIPVLLPASIPPSVCPLFCS